MTKFIDVLKLEIGKDYYFNSSTDECGTFIGHGFNKDIALFKPINKGDYNLDYDGNIGFFIPMLLGFSCFYEKEEKCMICGELVNSALLDKDKECPDCIKKFVSDYPQEDEDREKYHDKNN